MGFFKSKKHALVGIDISSSSVKVVELSKSGDHYRVERYTVEPLPQNAVVENAITDVEQVGKAVDRAVKRSGTRCRHAAVAVASSHVITKRISMPGGLREHELEQQIEMEADHYIPYPLEEVNLDFEVIGPSESNPNEDEVVIAACRKEIVDDYIAVVEGYGLTPSVVDVDAFAIESAYGLVAKQLPGGGLEKTVAVIDFGATTTHMNVMHNNRSVYTRDHAFGGRHRGDPAPLRPVVRGGRPRQESWRSAGQLPDRDSAAVHGSDVSGDHACPAVFLLFDVIQQRGSDTTGRWVRPDPEDRRADRQARQRCDIRH